MINFNQLKKLLFGSLYTGYKYKKNMLHLFNYIIFQAKLK